MHPDAPLHVRPRPRAASIVLALIPAVMITFAIPFVNHVEPRIFGLPFLLAWIVVWICLTPAFLGAVHRIESTR